MWTLICIIYILMLYEKSIECVKRTLCRLLVENVLLYSLSHSNSNECERVNCICKPNKSLLYNFHISRWYGCAHHAGLLTKNMPVEVVLCVSLRMPGCFLYTLFFTFNRERPGEWVSKFKIAGAYGITSVRFKFSPNSALLTHENYSLFGRGFYVN